MEAAAAATADLSLADGTNPKATKKEKVKKAAAAPAEPRPVDISRVDLRVGLIKKAWRHPGAERWAGDAGSIPWGCVLWGERWGRVGGAACGTAHGTVSEVWRWMQRHLRPPVMGGTPSPWRRQLHHLIPPFPMPTPYSLYVEEVDVGEENPRTVVSGLVKHIPEEGSWKLGMPVGVDAGA